MNVPFLIYPLCLLLILLLPLDARGNAQHRQASSRWWNTILLFERPERGAPFQELTADRITLTQSASSDNGFWYQTTLQGKTGWIYEGDLTLHLRPQSNNEHGYALYATLERISSIFLKLKQLPPGWIKRPDTLELTATGRTVTLASADSLIQARILPNGKTSILFARFASPQAAKDFLGFAAIGLSIEELENKLGPADRHGGESFLYAGDTLCLRYIYGKGDVMFSFLTKEGNVTEVVYGFPTRRGDEALKPRGRSVYLRHFRNAAAENWPQIASCTADSVNLRAKPSTQAKVNATTTLGEQFYLLDRVDRGEAHPWFFAENARTGLRSWVYGQFVIPADAKDVRALPFTAAFDFATFIPTALLESRIGAPLSRSTDKGENSPYIYTTDTWLGIDRVIAAPPNTKEEHLMDMTITASEWEVCGVRTGDPAESLDAFIEGMKAMQWTLAPPQKDKPHAENPQGGLSIWTSPKGDRSFSLETHLGKVTGMSWGEIPN